MKITPDFVYTEYESLCAPPIRSSATDQCSVPGAIRSATLARSDGSLTEDILGAARAERNRLFRTRLLRAPAPSTPPRPRRVRGRAPAKERLPATARSPAAR